MDPVSALAMVGTCAAIINQVIVQIKALCDLYQAVKGADAQLMSLIAQLNTMNAALNQIQLLMQKADYDQQLQMDLDLALQACTLLMGVLEGKVAKMKVKKGASTLKLKSKLKVVFDSKTMTECLTRLDHQAGALTLLISVLTSKTVTEQKTLLQRSNTRKVFKQLQEDSASIKLLQSEDDVVEDSSAQALIEDDETPRPTFTRSKTEQIISTNPWKRFGFDRQLLSSKAYGKKRKSKDGGKDMINETIVEVQPEQIEAADDDNKTLVDESHGVEHAYGDELYKPSIKPDPFPVPDIAEGVHPHFSKMLAFGHAESNVPNLIAQARDLWDAPAESQKASPRLGAAEVYSLKTRYFDMSIRYHTMNQTTKISEDFVASYRDTSSILFAVSVANYCNGYQGDDWLAADMQLFDHLANDYHLWLAKIILFLDISGLEDTLHAQSGRSGDLNTVVEAVRSRFLQAGRMGASIDRIHVHVGEPDEATAGAIFAVTNHASQTQSNKWSGLTRNATS